jgi:hypothetical protein
MPERRDVNDSEPTVPEQHTSRPIVPDPCVIRTTMREPDQHALESFFSAVESDRLGKPNSRDSTHGALS